MRTIENTEGNRYIQPHLSAYIRGRIMQGACPASYRDLAEKPLDELTDEDIGILIGCGKEHGMKLHHFKSREDLPRVKAVLGALHSIQPKELLDVGSGRGVFLYPFMRDFPSVPVTSVDILPRRSGTMGPGRPERND